MNNGYSKKEFEMKLREMEYMYHLYHPFQQKMNSGNFTKRQMQGWVANRFYYQYTIPTKDLAIISNNPPIEHRRLWIQRVKTHIKPNGALDAWLDLGVAVGLSKDDLLSFKYVLPGVKFAIDAYLNYTKRSGWEESVASSLSEMFAIKLHKLRLDTWPLLYPWIDENALLYFKKRLNDTPKDNIHALDIVLNHFNTYELQKEVFKILKFKLDVLWTMLDYMYLAYELNKEPYFNIKNSNTKYLIE
ncbi:pyrroloquinoline-quinone synthase PqqC [Arcobacter caeni]|uniref:Pyrroloquinoline-quinone synthase n=1 Tax=Arcobacter caeni TaxID=1912877 RepID=A0A363D459_9BACT|nr:pyrroloquinoline-quinone synthase PqqC [Arcobacter caeni]PUE66043.1 pyrroloquinoline quinone biosynthesis protein C [Arcobacter caeni]